MSTYTLLQEFCHNEHAVYFCLILCVYKISGFQIISVENSGLLGYLARLLFPKISKICGTFLSKALDETASKCQKTRTHSHIPDINPHYMFVLATCQPRYMMRYSTQNCASCSDLAMKLFLENEQIISTLWTSPSLIVIYKETQSYEEKRK
jgi:hypothetical protein